MNGVHMDLRAERATTSLFLFLLRDLTHQPLLRLLGCQAVEDIPGRVATLGELG
jgi:hypothetical protein